MEIKAMEIRNIHVIRMIGKLDTLTAPEAQKWFDEYLPKENSNVLINLKDTAYISSSGLRVFLVIAKQMEADNRMLKFCCPNDTVKEILDISGFSSMLEVKATQEEALNSFKIDK